jgi:fatty acid desaturase
MQVLEAGSRVERDDAGAVAAPQGAVVAPQGAVEALSAGVISLEALRALRELKASWGIRDLTLTAAEIVAIPLLYMTFPHPLTFVVCILWSIRTFNSCAQLVHETDHGTLFASPRLNNALGNVCAYILGYTRYGHRQVHVDHHLYLNTSRDPDTIFSQPYATGREILQGLLGDVFFLSAVKRFLQYFQSGDDTARRVAPWEHLTPGFLRHLAIALLPVALTQLVILGIYAVTAGAVYYLWFYVVPIMTIYPLQIRIRSIAEHSFELDGPPAASAWATRTSKLNLLERLVMAPLQQDYHYEHHLFPTIPNHNLPKVHQLLVEAGVSVPTTASYVGFVVRKIRADFARA